MTPVHQTELADIDAHDVIFPDIDLGWWLR
jgi:hypothetical protein